MLQSTSLLRGKTQPRSGRRAGRIVLQSTSLLRGKTNCGFHFGVVECASIHFPLAREDPVEKELPPNAKQASIHFPLAREDKKHIKRNRNTNCFNPLPSCEGRRISGAVAPMGTIASIHFPLAREDKQHQHRRIIKDASIHFPLAREDRIGASGKAAG